MEIQQKESIHSDELPLTEINQLNNNPILSLKKIGISEERAMNERDVQFNTNFSHGTLLLTTEKMSLVEEIKILIRKLWN